MRADGPRAIEVSNRYRSRSPSEGISRDLNAGRPWCVAMRSGLVAALMLALLVAGCGGARELEAAPTANAKPAAQRQAPFTDVTRPNIVFILTDDLSDDLI